MHNGDLSSFAFLYVYCAIGNCIYIVLLILFILICDLTTATALSPFTYSKVPETLISDVVLFSWCLEIIGAIHCTRFLKQKKFFLHMAIWKGVWGVDQIISKYSGFQTLD